MSLGIVDTRTTLSLYLLKMFASGKREIGIMGRHKSKSYEERLKEKYGDKIQNLEPYINLNTKIWHVCNKHDYKYLSTPSSVLSSKCGCPKCG